MSERPHDRVIDLSVEVPGSPDEVWQAIATGPGITSWFVPHQVEERPGGTVRMDFGPAFGEETAQVTAWEPPHRVVFASSGDRPMAFEWLVEARDGGTCVVRLVNSGFGEGDDWDAEYDAMTSGWKIFLQNLRLHLTHFRGQSARAVIPTLMTAGPPDDAFARLCAAFGIPDDLGTGASLAADGEGVPPLVGTVAGVMDAGTTRAYLVVTDSPAPGTAFLAAEASGGMVALSAHLYLYGPAAAGLPDMWSPFLAQRFPQDRPRTEESGSDHG